MIKHISFSDDDLKLIEWALITAIRQADFIESFECLRTPGDTAALNRVKELLAYVKDYNAKEHDV